MVVVIVGVVMVVAVVVVVKHGSNGFNDGSRHGF